MNTIQSGFMGLARAAIMLGLAIGIPMMILSPPKQILESVDQISATDANASDSDAAQDPGSDTPLAGGDTTVHIAKFTPNYASPSEQEAKSPTESLVTLQQAFRFDVRPEHITRRWPTLTTRLQENGLSGYRVPLVTGTQSFDLAGILTYFYNRAGQLEQITFKGTTDDYRMLLGVLQNYYGFVERPMNSQYVVVYEKPDPTGASRSYAWVQPAVGSLDVNTKKQFEVIVAIQRPPMRR